MTGTAHQNFLFYIYHLKFITFYPETLHCIHYLYNVSQNVQSMLGTSDEVGKLKRSGDNFARR